MLITILLHDCTFCSHFAALHIIFDQMYYLFGEAGDSNPPVTVQYGRTETEFTLKLQSYLLPFDPYHAIHATQGISNSLCVV